MTVEHFNESINGLLIFGISQEFSRSEFNININKDEV